MWLCKERKGEKRDIDREREREIFETALLFDSFLSLSLCFHSFFPRSLSLSLLFKIVIKSAK